MKVTYVPTGERKYGAFGDFIENDFVEKGGSFGVISKKRSFLVWITPPPNGVIQCAKMQFQFSSQNKPIFFLLKLQQNFKISQKAHKACKNL